MATRYDIQPGVLINKVAEELKKEEAIQPPVWASFVKTGCHKERAPVEKDWWYVRTASILRKISLKGPIGVSKLRVFYGGKKNRGVQPEIFKRASGNILRKVLQQLEKAGLAQQKTIGNHYGRVITPKGSSLLDKTAHALAKETQVEVMQPMVIDIKKKKRKITVAPPKKKVADFGFKGRGGPRGGGRGGPGGQRGGPPRGGAPRGGGGRSGGGRGRR